MASDDLEVIEWPDKVQGPASARRRALSFPLRVRAKTAGSIPPTQAVTVAGVKPAGARGKGKAAFGANASPLVLRDEGETMAGEVSLQLDRNMPPGQYVASLEVAGLVRDVVFDVVEDTSLRIRPSPAIIDTTRARRNEATVSFENRGNIPLAIDVRGDYPLGREELLAADVSDTQSVLSVLTAALNRAPVVFAEVGIVKISMPNGAFTLAPGQTDIASIAMTTTVKLDPARRYRAFIPVFASELEIAIVTAIKPEAVKLARTSGGKNKRN